jgi:Leucine-rich repeat (LRR) protein
LLDFQGVDLQKLILAHNNLEVLREDLRNLSSLVVLNISHNQISSLPAAIGEYVAVYPNSVISEIDADPYIIISLSDNLLLCSLPLLKSLDASFNQINIIPEEIGSATALVK